MRVGSFVWPILVSVACCGGGTTSVPVDQIPQDKKLVDLSSGESQGLCDWVTGLAKEKLSGASCNGSPININSCTSVGAMCTATVAEYRGCIPNFLDRIAADPCQVISLSFSQADLEAFVDSTPGCAGQGPCAMTMH
jgi:hypothetical protein